MKKQDINHALWWTLRPNRVNHKSPFLTDLDNSRRLATVRDIRRRLRKILLTHLMEELRQ